MKRVEKTLLFLAVLFLPTQLGRHFWPQFSFVYSLPIDYLSPTVYFWDILVICLVSLWFIKNPRINRTALNLLLIFILTQSVSLIFGNDMKVGQGLVRLEQYIISGLFGLYLSSISISRVKTLIFWALSIAVLGEAVLAILQFLKGGSLGLWILGERAFSLSTPAIAKFDFYGRDFLRPYATFPHPNVLAGFMVIVLPLISFLKPKKGAFLKLSAVLGMISALLTVSRAALTAGFLEALLFLRKRFFIWLIIVLILLSPFLYARFATLFSFDNLSLLRREELIGASWQIFLAHPILGIGLNNFISQGANELLSGPNRFLQPVHNIFLLSLSETGILGLLGLLLLLGYPVRKIFNFQFSIFNLLWAVVIFLGMFDHYFLTLPQGYRLLFVLWGISLSMLKS